ncbi:nuclear pore-associated protein 1-like isoform X1 [Balaenoptera acutorostrata]|uniref:Nuclear pore-associated protein 1-like isoform X1 n=1 Tax=Balaenoptera acutorostrata TaxID=9767 RepID=A0ABM3U805_BALAC|nr:nuclear pore-associated protein 1-like isoform X1 [Balaenoptera acutorostrata]XP_057410472.1 nuclear pore-associated protein 1-like isoform X1 [Balaenoptera acutorostrata]XP_057410473.1 nuclear pore-associated protein 1-like isoform X1 [Balaenoptera acutorostrata]
MGNLLCKFRTWLCRRWRRRPQCPPRRGAPVGCHPLVLPSWEAATSDRDHPAAPAPAFCPGRRLSHRDRVPLSPGFYIAPERQYPIQQARNSRLGMLPLVNWRDSPKKPVLSAHNSIMFGHSRAIKIPPLGHKFTLLRSPPEQVVKVRKPVPSSHLPLPSPKEREVKVQEGPQRGMAKMEDHTETKGEDDRKRGHRSNRDIPLTSRPQETSGVLTSLKCDPEPVDLPPEHPEDNLSENAQISPMSSSSESHVICSDGDPGDVLPPWKPESHAMVFSALTACCSLLLERPKKEVLGEDHRPKSPGSLMSGKELQREKSSDIPSRSSSSLVSTRSRPCKWKIPLPLFLPLPGLRSPLPLTRDREPALPSHGWKKLWIQIRGRRSSGAAPNPPRGGGRR